MQTIIEQLSKTESARLFYNCFTTVLLPFILQLSDNFRATVLQLPHNYSTAGMKLVHSWCIAGVWSLQNWPTSAPHRSNC